jgi:hypothetical protein
MSINKPLATFFPEVAQEAHGWDPTEVSSSSAMKMEWRCSKGHLFTASVGNRTNRGSGCPFCAGQKVLAGFNDLATVFPELAKEADGWDPKNYTSKSSKKLLWKCLKGHSWEARLADRATGGGCPYCSGRKVLVGFNDLKTILPELAKEAFGWDPNSVTIGVNKKLRWICSKGHTYSCTPAKRRIGAGCPYCSNATILPGFNDLQTRNPELAKEAFGWEPSEVFSGSDKKLTWKCAKQHVWTMRVADRSHGDGCPYCSGHKVLEGYNDLLTTHPELATESHGWDPRKVNAGSNKKLEWKCSLGHTWKAIVANRSYRGDSCVYCSNKEILAGFNDLNTTHPELAIEADGWNPQKYSAGSGIKLKWKCNEGHVWHATVGSRTNIGSGCPSCAKFGFDPSKDGFLYFLYHPDWIMYQIGITNVPEDRIARHKGLGWEPLEIRGPLEGFVTRQWEQDILSMLRKKGVVLGSKKGVGKFDGYTEAWDAGAFSVGSLKELMKLVEDNE